ncbi:hypothetical protein MKW98_016717, partial [Papaver atlanticum]
GGIPYQDALKNFIDIVSQKLGNPSKFGFPCVDCKNLALPLPPNEVHLHLLNRSMDRTYTEWVFHGEPAIISNDGDVHQEGATHGSEQFSGEANIEGDAHQD